MSEKTDRTENEFAPAKINLALHVTGRRADGYHLIETLVVFAGFGDTVSVTSDAADRFAITGPRAPGLDTGDGNLVIRARDLFRKAGGCGPVSILLEKNLPVASGIGGGSADAAATIRALRRLTGSEAQPDEAVILALGADVPMCLQGEPLVACGIGEAITPVSGMPSLHMVLANPGVAVPTPDVFRALTNRNNPPLPSIPTGLDAAGWAAWLSANTRNDLEEPAIALAPEIGSCLAALRDTAPLASRMSGSGATCFGIYPDSVSADAAARHIAKAHDGWFVQSTTTGASHGD